MKLFLGSLLLSSSFIATISFSPLNLQQHKQASFSSSILSSSAPSDVEVVDESGDDIADIDVVASDSEALNPEREN